MLLLLPSSTWPRAYMGDTYLTYLEDDLNTQCILCIYVFQCISICSKPIPVHPSPIHTRTQRAASPIHSLSTASAMPMSPVNTWSHPGPSLHQRHQNLNPRHSHAPPHLASTQQASCSLQLVLQIDGLVAVDKLVCCHLRNLLALLILPWIDQLRSADSSLRRDGPPRTIRVGSVHLVSTYTCVTSLVYQI